MWLPGGLVLWASMIWIFARWVRADRASALAEGAAALEQAKAVTT
jgi:hypothetical protein